MALFAFIVFIVIVSQSFPILRNIVGISIVSFMAYFVSLMIKFYPN